MATKFTHQSWENVLESTSAVINCALDHFLTNADPRSYVPNIEYFYAKIKKKNLTKEQQVLILKKCFKIRAEVYDKDRVLREVFCSRNFPEWFLDLLIEEGKMKFQDVTKFFTPSRNEYSSWRIVDLYKYYKSTLFEKLEKYGLFTEKTSRTYQIDGDISNSISYAIQGERADVLEDFYKHGFKLKHIHLQQIRRFELIGHVVQHYPKNKYFPYIKRYLYYIEIWELPYRTPEKVFNEIKELEWWRDFFNYFKKRIEQYKRFKKLQMLKDMMIEYSNRIKDNVIEILTEECGMSRDVVKYGIIDLIN